VAGSLRRILYLGFEHLNRDYGVMRDADPDSDLILLVESQRMLSAERWHFQRLYFMISSARHFAQELRNQGFTVDYRIAPTTREGIIQAQADHGITRVITVEPSSHRLHKELADLTEYIPSDFFLTSREDFLGWAKGQKKLLMENFYRSQRIKLDILMEGDQPLGGEWNYDQLNRQPLPKGHAFPPYLIHERDEIDEQVISELRCSGLELIGTQPDGSWATTRKGALKQLNAFCTDHLENFGAYEDAMTGKNWALHHSLLSPYLNIGLLHPGEVIDAVLDEFAKRPHLPIASVEGFIRQVIGWREYVNGVYWFFEEDYRESNVWKSKGKLPPLLDDPSKTEMNCLNQIVSEIHSRAWVHHIPRLMVLSNFALITGTDPALFLAWMRRVFIDAADWVMVPNVIGMSMHADGGRMMSKPYLAGGSYISKMSDYCDGCPFNPKVRIGEDACPFTTLYWHFIDENYEDLKKNHRMARQIGGISRLADVERIRLEGPKKIAAIRAGQL
jgi:deoxyribodipyrimidine photolyase-related protein